MMDTLNALLSEIVADPGEETRWLVLADWLEENDVPRRAELLRLHRKLLATCCEPDAHPERLAWHSRIVELIAEGVRPCVPQKTLMLPGDVPMTFAFIPPGRFRMGSDHVEGHDSEKPVHTVTLTRGFFLGIHPVTQAQWKAVTGTNPSYSKGPHRPVEQVTWDDCQAFCQKVTVSIKERLRLRLPTEAEWEYACRAGTTTEHHFGDSINPDLVKYEARTSRNNSPYVKYHVETTNVGSFAANPWGLYDLHGNVSEFCQDVWDRDFYQKSPARDPICCMNQEQTRVLRGGSFLSDPLDCRAATRRWAGHANRTRGYGCRVCFSLDWQPA